MSELGAAVARTRHSLTDAASGSSGKGKARHNPSLDEEYAWSVATEDWTLQEREDVSKALGLSSEDPEYVFDGYSDAEGFGNHRWGGGICHCVDCTRNRTPRTYASSSAYRLPEVRPARNASCVACMDRIEGPVIRAPCGHDYDVDCVVGLFRAATTDESLFPPACCRQPFNFQRLRQHMDRELASLFEKKAREFSTQNRVYCSRASCSAFLGPATNSATAMACNGCGTQTCGHCKKAAHSASQRCTNDADKEVLAMATREGWKRCPRCGLVVELIYGCNHMTCRCNHQFCYLCLARWKTCGCLNWDPIRLTEAANDPELLAEAIRNLNFEEPPRPIRAVDRRARLAEIENANLPHRPEPVIPRPRDIEAPLQDVRTPARPPPYARGYVPNEPMEASGSGQNRAPEPVPMLVAHPQLGWIISYGPAPYPPPLLDMFTVYPHGIAPGPPRVVCQQHWWTPSAPLVAGPIIRGCSSCGNWQGGLWMCAYCQTFLCATCRYRFHA